MAWAVFPLVVLKVLEPGQWQGHPDLVPVDPEADDPQAGFPSLPEDVHPVSQCFPPRDGVRATHFWVSSRIAAIRRAVSVKCWTSSGSNALPRT